MSNYNEEAAKVRAGLSQDQIQWILESFNKLHQLTGRDEKTMVDQLSYRHLVGMMNMLPDYLRMSTEWPSEPEDDAMFDTGGASSAYTSGAEGTHSTKRVPPPPPPAQPRPPKAKKSD